MVWTEAVSYTHLDVYKRQTLGPCLSSDNIRLLLLPWRLCAPGLCALFPLSRAHLRNLGLYHIAKYQSIRKSLDFSILLPFFPVRYTRTLFQASPLLPAVSFCYHLLLLLARKRRKRFSAHFLLDPVSIVPQGFCLLRQNFLLTFGSKSGYNVVTIQQPTSNRL